MSHDDDLVARLRGLGQDTPRVSVDRAEVLRAGRRRRSARAAGAGAWTALVLVGVVAAGMALAGGRPGDAAPAAPGPATTATQSATVAPAPLRAEVDRSTGTIALPLDDWIWSPAQEATSATAVELSVSLCMAQAGMADEFVFQGPYPVASRLASYGVWRDEDVRASGYEGVSGAVDYPGTGLRGDDPRIATQRGCYGDAFDLYGVDPAEFEDSAPQGYESPTSVPQGLAVWEEWRQCLVDEGVAPPADAGSMVPEGVTSAPMAEQVRVGLIDVGCKDRTDFVQRLGDVEAAEQQAYIERGRAYLSELRAVQQRALAESRALLTSHGVPIPGE
ncbi:hypothetical protein [Cellulomonas sp. Y8]|uniref:hypothetical protein n=1 Tax=Cellulomonas sp. Y8 TaxID=2591145 RepID=UPI003D708F49